MRIIPVIDLKGGRVVRAVGGRRAEYAPLVSPLTASSSAADVIAGIVAALAPREIYVADLTAIEGGEVDWNAIEALGAAGVTLWLDAGVGDADRAQWLAGRLTRLPQSAKIVIGLESVDQPESLGEIVRRLSSPRLAFSIDLFDGRPLAPSAQWRETPPLAIADRAVAAGFSSLIVLDLARVGEGKGPGALPLCEAIRKKHRSVELVGGGGVRDRSDLHTLAQAGCDAALVASALHCGRLAREDINKIADVGRRS